MCRHDSHISIFTLYNYLIHMALISTLSCNISSNDCSCYFQVLSAAQIDYPFQLLMPHALTAFTFFWGGTPPCTNCHRYPVLTAFIPLPWTKAPECIRKQKLLGGFLLISLSLPLNEQLGTSSSF